MAAYCSLLRAPRHLSKALAIPLLLAVGIAMANILLSTDQDSGFSVSSTILQLLPFVLVGLAWARFELLGEDPSLLPDNSERRRFFVFAGYLLLFGLVLLGIIFVTVATLATSVSDYVALGGLAFVSCLIACWPLARICLVLPATAIDQGLGLGGAWRLSSGNSARLFAALVLVSVPIVVILGLFVTVLTYLLVTGTLPAEASLDKPETLLFEFVIAVVANGLQLIGFALLMSTISKAYATLSGWGGPRAEILERFE